MSAPNQTLHIDLAAIPDFRREELARCVLASLKEVMAQPGAEEEFQAWLKDYKAKQKAAQKGDET